MEKNILLCSKCVKKNIYILPKCTINIENNEVEYICQKHNILSEDDLFAIELTDKLKNSLNMCQIHNDAIFCGWCEICSKNLCHICIGEEIKKKHDFKLYDSLITKGYNKEFYDEKIKDMISYLKEIKIYYVDMKKYAKEIKLLEIIIDINKINYNLFFIHNIKNYQIILNLISNMDFLLKNYEKYKSMSEKKYSIFLSFIKGKEVDNIIQKKININNQTSISNIIIFNSELNDEENDENNTDKNNDNVIILLSETKQVNLISYTINSLKIYDMNGNLLNSILLQNYRYKKIIQYKSNILLLFYEDFWLPFISFYIFSPDFKNYEFVKEIDLSKIIKHENHSFYISLCSFPKTNNIIKIEKNKLLIFYWCTIYIIKLNDDLIFKNIKYYKAYQFHNSQDYNNFDKVELIEKYEYCAKVIPIYSRDINNRGILDILTLSFEGDLLPEDELILKKYKNEKYIYYTEYAMDEKPDYDSNGYNLKLKKFYYHNLSYKERTFYETSHIIFSEKDKIWESVKRIKIFAKLKKFNAFNNDFSSKFMLSPKDVETLLKIKNNYLDLDYCYSTNYIIFLLNNIIYQINYNTFQPITIYELDSSFIKESISNKIVDLIFDILFKEKKSSDKKEDILNKLSQYYLLNIIHYYKKDLQKMVELILFKNTENNFVYPYYWECHELKPIKPFNLADFQNVIELNFFESSNNVMKNSLNLERILLDKNELVIFK